MLTQKVARRLRDEVARGVGLPRSAYLLATGRLIPFLRPYWDAEEIEVGRAGRGDDELTGLERDLRDRLGGDGLAVTTSSGRTAMRLALAALRRERPTRDEVVLPTYCCRGVLDPVVECGLRPIFADVGTDLNLDRATVSPHLGPRTLAVVVAHLGGKHAAETSAIQASAAAHGAVVIEDLCQALGGRSAGQRWGETAAMAFYSFGLGKNAMATAGGLLVARIAQEAVRDEAARLGQEPEASSAARFAYMLDLLQRDGLRGLAPPTAPPRAAFADSYGNYRMSARDAGVLRRQLAKVDEIVRARTRNAERLAERLRGTPGISMPAWGGPHVWTKFTVLAETPALAAGVRARLARAGVETEPMYGCLHLRPGDLDAPVLPAAERAAPRAFNLPVRPALRLEQVDYVAEELRRAVAAESAR